MRLVRFDIERIKESDFVFPLPHDADALSPDTYDHMFVLVPFETAESIGSYFKISQVEFC